MSFRTRGSRAFLLLFVAGACRDAQGSGNASSQTLGPTSPVLDAVGASAVPSVSTLLGRATFVDPQHNLLTVQRAAVGWHVEVKAEPSLDVAMQTINFPVGAQSTWHKHPGPVFIVVAQGTMRFYMGDDPTCTPVERTVGQGFIDRGEHTHIARNESGAPAQTVVTYMLPQGAPLKVDQPRPGNCPF